ncbi:MAG: ATP-binding cassette domain-containing protein, partial [Pseudomonadota bacterium]
GAVGAPRLRATDLSLAVASGIGGLHGVSFTVRGGEIYGVAGVAGNGQGALAAVLAGIASADGGGLEIDGSKQGPGPANRAVIPEDRYRYGLAAGMGVADNHAVHAVLAGRHGGWWRLDRSGMRRAAATAIKSYDVQGVRSLAQRAALLSGGNAQKLVIAREFGEDPAVVLAHSPSRGLDVRAGAAVHDRLRAARDRGAAVVLISEDLDEIMLLADRIGVLNRGRIVAEFDQPADRAQIGAAMVAHDD